MNPKSFRSALLAAGITIALSTTGCGGSGSSSSGQPKPGTIGHAWLTANESYKTGDYARSMEYLSRVAANQNEYREQARLKLIVVASGVADGYVEMAKAYEDSARVNRNQASELKKRMMESRNAANNAAMLYAETVNDVLKTNKDLKVAFDFPFPEGSTSEPPAFTKLNKGYAVQAADHDVIREAMIKRGVVKFASALAGAPDDPAKAKAQWANPSRDAVVTAVTQGLYTKADLYCQRKLDIPKRGNVLCQKALETLALLPDSKDKKTMEAKIKDELKRFKIAS